MIANVVICRIWSHVVAIGRLDNKRSILVFVIFMVAFRCLGRIWSLTSHLVANVVICRVCSHVVAIGRLDNKRSILVFVIFMVALVAFGHITSLMSHLLPKIAVGRMWSHLVAYVASGRCCRYRSHLVAFGRIS